MFFKDQIKKRIKNEKGLTLIELLAVVVILAIIAAIAIPAIGNIIDNQRVKAVKADAANILSSAQTYYADGGSTSTTFTLGTGANAADYVDLGNTTITGALTVTSAGVIKGTIVKNGKTLVMDSVTLAGLQVDSKSKTGTGYTITP